MGKRQRQKFWTGMTTLVDEPFQPEPPFTGAGWQATLSPQRPRPHKIKGGQEVILQASSWSSAQRALDLILGCHQLVQGPHVFDIHLVANNADEPGWIGEHERKALSKQTYSSSDIPLACAIAAKASRNRKWFYGVAKYRFSLSLYSVQHMDMEPWHSHHLPISAFPSDHVTFSYSIISAYSVIEDLGLEVRASPKKPSRIQGEWNPAVKHDLEERLVKDGVDLRETFLWIVRGSKRKIETRRPLPPGSKAPWSAWIVRDSELQVVDAIAYADWLRDHIASHGMKELTRSLSPYDVVNVQDLARRLLLESLGFWRYWEKAKEQKDRVE
jgi:hypothetical protein